MSRSCASDVPTEARAASRQEARTAFGHVDTELVAAAQGGDAEAFRRLMVRHMPVVTGFLYGKFPEPEDALDVCQEVLLSVYCALPSLKDARRFPPWLMKIARNKLKDHYRERFRRLAAEAPAKCSEAGAFPGDQSRGDASPSPAEQAQEKEFAAHVSACIGRLPDKYRVVAYLRLLEECETREIAELLGLNESTVRTRLSRGLRSIRKQLQRLGYGP